MIAFAIPEAGRGSGDLSARNAAVSTVSRDILRSVTAGEFTLQHRFRSVNALAGDITADGVLRLLENPNVVRVDLDAPGSGNLAEAVPLVHLDVVHNLGLTGKGVTVAVIDTGIDTDHPDLRDAVVDQQCFCSSLSGGGGCCPNGASTQSGPGSAEDDQGHGTNVSGIITSNGTVAPTGGAPDARIVAVKVIDRNNRFCCVSDVVAGLDWIINTRPDVQVVNMSLGTDARFSGDCDNMGADPMAFATAINTLRARGTTVFAASGNNASGTQMSAPACVANAISVGAVYDSNVGAVSFGSVCTDSTTEADKVTCFSNSDTKTDLFAPGALTTSTGMGGGTSTFRGTSQASPLAAACAACLLQANQEIPPFQISRALKTTPTHVTSPLNGLAFPRVDCEAALAVAQMPATEVVCSAGTSIKAPQITISKLGAPGGDEKLVFKGKLVFPPGTPSTFDPLSNGAQVLIEDLGSGGTAVLDLTGFTHPVPAGAPGTGCNAKDGWRANKKRTTYTYTNKSNFLDPGGCSVSANGLTQVKFVDRRASAGIIDFTVTTKGSVLPTPVGPLRGTIVPGGDSQSAADECGRHTFSASSCSAKRTTFKCK